MRELLRFPFSPRPEAVPVPQAWPELQERKAERVLWEPLLPVLQAQWKEGPEAWEPWAG